ncbi:FAD-binding oxidoreductase [Dactylosporangium matsuzakiense]|uniref:FAD-linked oxidase n=1 Tax=Dactylosporangium matsuzakiense TaxID=53360 RepID=A0A9W6KG28_9ACTN|nr:FAD-binding oxidoreductase [Dactylosporangium matsuzakiense]UWZ44430.1 FAD-binding oxidoreductase [Dactylosporangium matsuzakiense]GLK99404.1 FAD-linked oxidase [Dactylosporangium matsuzakiense]
MTTALTSLPAVAGPVYVPGDEGFAAEVFSWNVATTHEPLAVVGATNAQDVAEAVRWAGTLGLPVAVQATGHGAVRPAKGGILITTTRMAEVSVDPVARVARAAAGARWSQVIAAAAPHGLAPLSGSSSQVGVVGYTLGGGVGPLGRKHGFAADHVRRVEIVTADGALRTVDADHEADLFWAVRGGKGNFGIVTAIEFDLVAAAEFFGGGIYYPGRHASEILQVYSQWSARLPEEMSTSVALLRLPDAPMVPPPLRGALTVHLRVCFLGRPEEGEALLAPMRAAAPSIIDDIAVLPYAAIDAVHRDPTDPMPSRERGVLLDALTPETVERIVAAAGPDVDIPVPMVEIRHLGGAFTRPPAVANAVSGRGAQYVLFAIGLGLPELAPVVDAAIERILAVDTVPGGLMNFSGGAGPEAIQANWAPADRDRLLRVKRSYDPTNVFSSGQPLLP